VQYPRDFIKNAYEMIRAKGGVCVADEVNMQCQLVKRRIQVILVLLEVTHTRSILCNYSLRYLFSLSRIGLRADFT